MTQRPIEGMYSGSGMPVGGPREPQHEEIEELAEDAWERARRNEDPAAMGDGGSMMFTPYRFARQTFQCGSPDPEVIGGLIKFVDGCGLTFLTAAHLDKHLAAIDETTGSPVCSGSVMCPHCQAMGRDRCMPETELPSHIQEAHPERN